MTGGFPAGFLWGAATAAYQIEGAANSDGRGPSIWDVFSHIPGRTRHGDTGDIACDHYHRFLEDLDLLAGLGVGAYRFSVSWSRVLPSGRGPINERGLDFYDRLTDGLLERGIMPVITLYHWDLPQALEEQGGWRHRDCVQWFGDYASVMFDALGDRIPMWITLNEPIAASFAAYGSGVAAPGMRSGEPALAASHHLLLGHAEAVRRHRDSANIGQVGITLNFSQVRPASDHPGDVAAAERLNALRTRWFADPIFIGEYPKVLVKHFSAITDFGYIHDGDLEAIAAPLDFLGVNYYKAWVAVAAPLPPAGQRVAFDLGAEQRVPPGAEVTDIGWAIGPRDLRDMLVELDSRYDRLPPLYITENGCAFNDYVDPNGAVVDPERISFLQRHLDACRDAIAAGVDLRGYFVWSLLDNFEWQEGYSKRFGLVYVDYPTGTRIPKASYYWYRDLVAGAG